MSWVASRAVMELRVHMCQSGVGSKGIRDFWVKNYNPIKAANAKLPILLRESDGATAKVTATYEFGVEKTIDVEGMSSENFGSQLQTLLAGK